MSTTVNRRDVFRSTQMQPLGDSLSDLDLGEAPRFAIGTREMGKLRREDVIALDLASIPHASFLIGANERIEDVNARGEAILGHARTKLVGELFDRMLLDLAPTSIPSVFGARVHHRDGRDIAVEVLFIPHDIDSRIAFVTPHDAEDGLHESDVAEIVHDLKNPLSTIALEMVLLGDTLGTNGQTDLVAAVHRVTRNVDFLDRMVQDLLDSCAIAAGELAIHRRPTEVRSLLEHVIDRAVATRDRARVFLEAPAMLVVSIDDLRIERVVANLISNALKYSPRTSGIVVRLETITGFARVSVIDGGPGMTAEETSFVFDKYRRTNSARIHEGSGLGLFVSKQIIEAHGGAIDVESVLGIGSRFFFELPTT